MSFSYDETLPTLRDQARSWIGDTDASEPLHSDEHITAVLAQEGGLALSVAYLAYELYMRFAQDPVREQGDGTLVDHSARLGAWQALATPIWTRQADAVAGVAAPVAQPRSGLLSAGQAWIDRLRG